MPDSMPMYSFDFLNQSFKPTTGPEECGAQITSPDDFIQHFNAEHRQDLANAMSTRLGGNQTLLSAGASTTTSSANPFDISLLSSQESLKNPSPLTPLSTPHEPLENDYAKHQYSPSHLSLPDADHTTTAIETEWEHKCLWCHDLGSEPCGKIFADAGELFTHVNTAHIKHLVKGPKGFRCGWETCRREDDGKDGFPQRSKIERHMQTHIERKSIEWNLMSHPPHLPRVLFNLSPFFFPFYYQDVGPSTKRVLQINHMSANIAARGSPPNRR